ncbi:MAG: Gfo/Idh/MocA family oxidoreductase [bacterium]
MPQGNEHLSRREFVKRGAMATATVTAFNVLKSPEARAAAPLKIGLIGCGGRGKNDAKRALQADKNVQFVALADIFEDRMASARKFFADEMGAKIDPGMCFLGWDAYKKLLATDVDIVMLITPPVFRPMMLTAAVDAKKHVFMEKPAAVDAPGVREIIQAGEKAKSLGLSIVAGTQRRYAQNRVEAVKRVQNGEIGEIVAARAYWCGGAIGFHERENEWTDLEYQMRNWYHFLWLSGDHIVEQHVHNLDMIHWAMQTHPATALGYGGRAWQKLGNIWDHHTVDFTFDNGVHLNSMCRQIANCADNVSEFVVGTKGSSDLKWFAGDWKFDGEAPDQEIQEQAVLFDSIRKGEPVNAAKDIAISTMYAVMGRMAGYSGQAVTWDEAYNSNETLAPEKIDFGPIELKPLAIPGGREYAGEGWVTG